MKKIITLSIATGIIALVTSTQAAQKSDRGFYAGIDGGPAKSHLQFDKGSGKKNEYIKSYGFDIAGGYMGNYGYLMYGAEANVGFEDGDKTAMYGTTTFKTNRGLDNDFTARIGMKTGRSSTYAIGGFGWSVFKVKSTSPTLGRSTKTNYLFGSVLGAGIMYDILPNFSARIEYKHSKYEDFTVPKTVIKMKPYTDKVYFGLIYRI